MKQILVLVLLLAVVYIVSAGKPASSPPPATTNGRASGICCDIKSDSQPVEPVVCIKGTIVKGVCVCPASRIYIPATGRCKLVKKIHSDQ